MAGRGRQQTLASHGECAIGFTGQGEHEFYVATADFVRWINTSVRDYAVDLGDGVKRVGTAGDVVCNAEKDFGNWGIYHSK